MVERDGAGVCVLHSAFSLRGWGEEETLGGFVKLAVEVMCHLGVGEQPLVTKGSGVSAVTPRASTMHRWPHWFCGVSVGLCFPSHAACPPGCLECDSDGLCHRCDSTTFLENKTCVPACGQGSYGSTWTRECEEGECK